MPTRRFPACLAGGLGAALLTGGCGTGLFEPDAAAPAEPADGGVVLSDGGIPVSVTATIGQRGGEVLLEGQARLLVRSGALTTDTAITLRRLPPAAREPVLGPIFEIVVEGPGFRQQPVLEITPPGPARPGGELAVGSRKGSSDYLWLPLTSGRGFDPATGAVRGEVTVSIGGGVVPQFGVLLWCGSGGVARCEDPQSCQGGICQ